MSRPEITVVIPNFNYGHFLSEALDSVLVQTRQDFEILVIDNFSTDNSQLIAESKKSQKIRFEQFDNKGVIAAARNRGVELARGKLIAFLDSDDLWKSKKLEIQTLKFGDENGVSYHDLSLLGTRAPRKFRGWDLGTEPLNSLLTNGNPIATSSVLTRRSLLLGLGGFSERKDLFAVEDYALWLKIAEAGNRFTHQASTLGSYRVHSGASKSVDSPAATMALIDAFAEKLTEQEYSRAKGFVAYAQGVRQLSLGNREIAIDQLMVTLRQAAPRFRWRAAVRMLQALRLPASRVQEF